LFAKLTSIIIYIFLPIVWSVYIVFQTWRYLAHDISCNLFYFIKTYTILWYVVTEVSN